VKYVILMQIDPAVLEQLTEEQQQMIGDGHGAFMAATKESGEFIATQALGDPSRSKVVRSVDGRSEVTDGPFVEAKEFMGAADAYRRAVAATVNVAEQRHLRDRLRRLVGTGD
jgi:hypothetical protein